MKRFYFSPIASVLFILFIMSGACTHDKVQPECGDPKPASCNIILVDNNDSTLIGTKYVQDSVELTLNGKKINYYIYNGIITINFDTLQNHSADNYILYLTYSDQDTLNLLISTVNTQNCGSYLNMDAVHYNGSDIPPNQNFTFKVHKN
jgi:hypothetical protein